MALLKITRIIRVGSSLGIIIPKVYLDAVNLKRGDDVFLAVCEDKEIRIIKYPYPTIT